MNKGQQIARTQELDEGKIAYHAEASKQAYTENQPKDDLPEPSFQEPNQP